MEVGFATRRCIYRGGHRFGHRGHGQIASFIERVHGVPFCIKNFLEVCAGDGCRARCRAREKHVNGTKPCHSMVSCDVVHSVIFCSH